MSISNIREKVSVNKLQVGMYGCDLDRLWLETPYPLQGFSLRSEKEIRDLMKYCSYVYIDVNLTLENELKQLEQDIQPAFSDKDKLHINKINYIDSLSMEEELPQATEDFAAFSSNTEMLIKNLQKGQKLDLRKFKDSTKQMIESVIRNPDAFLWLVRLKQSDDYMYQHSLRCSVLAVAFGPQLGLTKRQLNNLAIGAALLDVGKLKLPKSLLNRTEKLTEDEFEMIRDHVRLSLEMISAGSRESKQGCYPDFVKWVDKF